MKRILILFLATLIAAGVVCGCEGSKEEKLQTYEYKGIEFQGEYHTQTKYNGDTYEIFIIDKEFLQDGGGLDLYEISYNAAMAFATEDDETLRQYLSDDEYWNDWTIGRIMPTDNYSFKDLNFDSATPGSHKDDEIIGVLYRVHFNLYNSTEDGFSVYIGMNVFLNDNNEWKVMYIDYNG